MTTQLGLDYAAIDNDEPPNWELAKQPSSDGSRLRFVIMRATYGDWIDTDFLRDFPGIKAAGLKRGAYLYPLYKNGQGVQMTPKLLVNTFGRALQLGGYTPGKDMVPFIDIESGGSPRRYGMSAATTLAWYEEIYQLVKDMFGADPSNYTSGRVWKEDLGNALKTTMIDSLLWLAKPWPWAVHSDAHRSITQAFANGAYDPEVPIPWGGGNWAIHQYQGDSWGWPGIKRPLGVAGQVDCNRFHVIKEGYRGPLVKSYQKRLGIAVDGDFGPKTTAAVKSVQAANGLVQDGIIGIDTHVPISWLPIR